MLSPADGAFATPRCRVRFAEIADAAAIYEIRSRMPWDPPTRDFDETVAMMTEMAERTWHAPGWRQFAVLVEDQVVGDIGVHFDSPTALQAELGFAFHPDARGRGLALESVSALVERLFECTRLHRIAATTDARNVSAQRLLDRLRFRREAHFVQSWPHGEGEWSDEFAYARLATD
jgi:RimJ/RimL family protein N-acetyltransferase